MFTVQRTKKTLSLAFFGIFACSLSVKADESDEDFALQYVSADKFLQIYSDHKIDIARCKWISDRVRKAYDFDNAQESWHNQELLFAKPLKFRVISNMKTKILGYAQGPNLMVVQDDYLDNELSEGTLAHELTHIQDARQLLGGKLPSYFLEGRALTNGHNYRKSLGLKSDSYDRDMAKSAMNFTSDDAEEVLSEFRSSGWKMQALGTFLVEYMRTKWKGTGVQNVNVRLSQMIEKIAGGSAFEAAFEKEFGSTFMSLCESFAKYLDSTAAAPKSRLEGTMWQDLIQADASSLSKDEDEDE
jgi:hypothetical protein